MSRYISLASFDIAAAVISTVREEIASATLTLASFMSTPIPITLVKRETVITNIFEFISKHPDIIRVPGIYAPFLEGLGVDSATRQELAKEMADGLDSWAKERTGKEIHPDTKAAIMNELFIVALLAALGHD